MRDGGPGTDHWRSNAISDLAIACGFKDTIALSEGAAYIDTLNTNPLEIARRLRESAVGNNPKETK